MCLECFWILTKEVISLLYFSSNNADVNAETCVYFTIALWSPMTNSCLPSRNLLQVLNTYQDNDITCYVK